MSIDPRALGFESEEALIEAVRARLGIPDDCSVEVEVESADGRRVLALVVTGHGRAHTAASDETR